MKKYVIYYRVSTKQQGDSGLGLEAQERDIAIFLSTFADEPYEVVGTFTDIASGRKTDRAELTKAIAMARVSGGELLVSRLDRLSRRVSFISKLMDDKKVRFRVATMPHADNLQLHIYAALAEQEREFISIRTKQALASAKARGVKLGGYRAGHAERVQTIKDTADADAQRVADIILPMRKGKATLQAIADALNIAGVPTARGGQWHPSSVSNTIARLAA